MCACVCVWGGGGGGPVRFAWGVSCCRVGAFGCAGRVSAAAQRSAAHPTPDSRRPTQGQGDTRACWTTVSGRAHAGRRGGVLLLHTCAHCLHALVPSLMETPACPRTLAARGRSRGWFAPGQAPGQRSVALSTQARPCAALRCAALRCARGVAAGRLPLAPASADAPVSADSAGEGQRACDGNSFGYPLW
jgi:hypothetical protein